MPLGVLADEATARYATDQLAMARLAVFQEAERLMAVPERREQ